MKFIIGGAFQGKTHYAEEKYGIAPEDWADGQDCSRNEIYHSRGVMHFHQFVGRSLQNGDTLDNFVDELMARNPDIIIVANELGYGIVPADSFDRRYRETDGRICTEIASRADEVIRIVCVIPTVITKV